MFVQLFSVIFLLQLVAYLNAHDDNFSASELVDYFDGESVEGKNREEREAIEAAASDDNRLASIISQTLLRANHYWTRKRGRDGATTPEAPKGAYPTVYATKYPYVANKVDSRRKREVMRKFAQLNQLSSRQKRLAEIDTGAAEANLKKQNSGSESGSSVEEGSKDLIKPSEVPNDGPHGGGHREGHPRKPIRKNFGHRLNHCCDEESDFPGFNQTLSTAKAQCIIETRNIRKNANNSVDTFDFDGGLYNMFSCDRIKRAKTALTCTVDCVAKKIGMMDSNNNVINIDVAKRTVIDNFAIQDWEKSVSDKLVEKCANETATSTRQPVDSFGFQCSSKAAEFAYCIWRELFLTCPADKQKSARQCDKLRIILGKSNDNKFINL